MDLLFLIIIIMVILSSLSRYFRGEERKKGGPSAPRPPGSSTFRDLLEQLRGEIETGRDAPERERREEGSSTGREAPSAEGPRVSGDDYYRGESYAPYDREAERRQAAARRRAAERGKKPAPPPTPSPGAAGPEARPARAQRKKGLPVRDTGSFERELQGLFTGEKIPLGIVASEVLGQPRAKRPYGRRRG